jgi:hypothetical protein
MMPEQNGSHRPLNTRVNGVHAQPASAGAVARTPIADANAPGSTLVRAEPLAVSVRRWIIRGSLSALGLSIGLHLLFLIGAAWWTINAAQAGGSTGREAGSIDLAIGTESELAAIEEAALAAGNPDLGDVTEAVSSPDALISDLPAVESAAGAGGVGDIAESMGGAGGDIGGAGGLGGFGDSGSGGGGAAKFFGVEATGTRFAYVVDVSGSMQGAKLNAMKIELIESIDALLEHMQFFVSPYSTEAMLLGNKDKWTVSSDNGKKWARDLIKDLPSYGGTNPVPSFQKAFDLKPRPDAIYFMTDGLFAEDVAHLVSNMNKRGKRVPIHCIAFDIQDQTVEVMMKKIAEESGGQFTAVPLTRSSR